MIPRISFELSLNVAAIYAIEMLMEMHPVEVKVKSSAEIFDSRLLKKRREELSISSFLWHLKPFIAITQDVRKALTLYFENEIAPLLDRIIRTYEARWRKILPVLKEDVKYLTSVWERYGDIILSEIAKISRHPWRIDEIKVYIVEPIIGGHGDAYPEEGMIIFEGVRINSPQSIIGLVHEITHINTLPPLIKILENKDIRSKVLYEIVNEYVTEQALVNANILPALDDSRLRSTFTESIREWMTESRLRFTYDPEILKQIIDKWWVRHLKSSKNLAQSFVELEKEALQVMKIESPK